MIDSEQLRSQTARYWDQVAPRYLKLFRNELDQKPFDRELLSAFAASLPQGARVLDAGCGPCGHVTRLLADAGLQMTGIDLSPNCIALARTEQPALTFAAQDMTATTFDAGSFAGLVAYYSLHYLPRTNHDAAFHEFARLLAPGGQLLIAVKEGSSEGWIDDPMGTGERVFWCEFQADELSKLVTEAGFSVLRCTVRDPLPGEIAVRRIYLLAELIVELPRA